MISNEDTNEAIILTSKDTKEAIILMAMLIVYLTAIGACALYWS